MKKIISLILSIIIIISSIIVPQNTNVAAEEEPIELYVYGGRNMCKSGKYIYYIRPNDRKNPGIVRYNPKTKKKKLIVPNEINNHKTGYFYYNLEVKGKYIYCVWDIADPQNYMELKAIYRFTKDGKEKKFLAYGENMVIVGNRIYYDKLRVCKENGEKYTEEYNNPKRKSMKLNGTDKKDADSTVDSQSNRSMEKLYYFCDFYLMFPVPYGKYEYYVENYDSVGKKKLCRVNEKTGKTKVIMKLNKNDIVDCYCISDNYLSICISNYKKEAYKVCLMKTDGKGKVVLEKWR